MMYNETIRDCFFLPRHVGVLDLSHNKTVVVKNNLKGQGIIELYMQCNQDGMIQQTCFKSNGNPYVIAALEWLCRQLEHQALDSLPVLDYQLIIRELDIPRVQYPVALRIAGVYKEILEKMNHRWKT